MSGCWYYFQTLERLCVGIEDRFQDWKSNAHKIFNGNIKKENWIGNMETWGN